MNERIAELKAQSISREMRGTNAFDSYMVDIFNTEKFAELIVRECMEINKQELAFNAFERLMNKYKEHFGVEE
jgi:hypothetical protein